MAASAFEKPDIPAKDGPQTSVGPVPGQAYVSRDDPDDEVTIARFGKRQQLRVRIVFARHGQSDTHAEELQPLLGHVLDGDSDGDLVSFAPCFP